VRGAAEAAFSAVGFSLYLCGEGFEIARVVIIQVRPHAAMKTVANRNFGISGGGSLTRPVSRRPPISLHGIVARTEGYTYAAKVWDLSIVQGPFSVAPCQNPFDSQLLHHCTFGELKPIGGWREQIMAQKLSFSPVEGLFYIAPIAFAWLVLAITIFERDIIGNTSLPPSPPLPSPTRRSGINRLTCLIPT
jgi:hypothetical protein